MVLVSAVACGMSREKSWSNDMEVCFEEPFMGLNAPFDTDVAGDDAQSID